jgi:hypothetical protein
MYCLGRLSTVALIVLTLTSARAEGPVRTQHPALQPTLACLNLKERRAANESGKVIRLAVAMHVAKKRMPGAVVRARLCHSKGGLVYVLTVLARDGKVGRLTVDAAKGTVVGKR